MTTIAHNPSARGYTVCVVYEDPHRELPIYHGPPLNPRYAHPYFPGTVLPYAEAADWRGPGAPQPLANAR